MVLKIFQGGKNEEILVSIAVGRLGSGIQRVGYGS
jgi:hypothetical protein